MFTNEWPSPELWYSGDGCGGDGGGGEEVVMMMMEMVVVVEKMVVMVEEVWWGRYAYALEKLKSRGHSSAAQRHVSPDWDSVMTGFI